MKRMTCPNPECGRRVFDIETMASAKSDSGSEMSALWQDSQGGVDPEEETHKLHKKVGKRE